MTGTACTRCSRPVERLDKPPFRGALGQRIHENVCRDCWAAWQAEQTKIINEMRLSLGDPRAQETLDRQMKAYLGLGG